MSDIAMLPYYDLMRDILENGVASEDRTGTGTLSTFGRQLRFNLQEGFPLLPGKFTPFNLVLSELLWFLSGSTNNEDLRRLNGNDKPTIWEEWSLPNGDLGAIYGEQLRDWRGRDGESIDQIRDLICRLKEFPNSRRHIVSCWNVTDIPFESLSPQENAKRELMALAPCHYSFQMYLRNNELSCMVNMRSVDTFLGLPFNIASYALLTHMIASLIGAEVGELIMSLGDCHIYKNHIDQVNELLSRDLVKYKLCTLVINDKITSIDSFTKNDFHIVNYQSHPAIKAEVSV